MKTGNNSTPNPKGVFKGPFKKEASNLVKPKTGHAFSAKRDSHKKGK